MSHFLIHSNINCVFCGQRPAASGSTDEKISIHMYKSHTHQSQGSYYFSNIIKVSNIYLSIVSIYNIPLYSKYYSIVSIYK